MLRSKAEVVQKMFLSIEGGYIREAGRYLSEDFVFRGPSPLRIGKSRFLELHQALINAIPDWSYHMSDVREKDGTVFLRVHITGTNLGRIVIPALGLFDVPATGRRFALPEEGVTVRFNDGTITQIETERVPNGGVSGILSQLGIEAPELTLV